MSLRTLVIALCLADTLGHTTAVADSNTGLDANASSANHASTETILGQGDFRDVSRSAGVVARVGSLGAKEGSIAGESGARAL